MLIHIIIHSLDGYLLDAYYMPGTAWIEEDTVFNKSDSVPILSELIYYRDRHILLCNKYKPTDNEWENFGN